MATSPTAQPQQNNQLETNALHETMQQALRLETADVIKERHQITDTMRANGPDEDMEL